MISRLNVATIYVLDKDEALDFYVNKLGLEKGNDVRQGDYRWLTVRVPGETTEINLGSGRVVVEGRSWLLQVDLGRLARHANRQPAVVALADVVALL